MNRDKLDLLPQSPGIYKFYDIQGKILYVGKALNLRTRVKSYFSNDLYDRPRIKQMVPLIADVKVVETNNEIESLVLESVLIKQYQPYYNSDKKDDKSYAWIYITTKDEYPTVKVVRNVSNNQLMKGQLFGPYPSASATKRIFTYLRKIYPFCTCKKESSSECLYFHLGLCPGPYQGHITKKDYRKNINEIIKFLRGKKRGQIKQLEKEMKEYSVTKQYEKAAQLRDKIADLKYLGEQIDFDINDTELSYTKRRKNLLKENFLNLKTELGLKKLNRIECYDISNIQGQYSYGSMVVAQDGEIRREEYRIFKIRGDGKPNDPTMLKEVLERRFDPRNTLKYTFLPDLVLIDGGKSQLSIVKNTIPKNIYLLGISKGKRLKRKGGKLMDEFWFFFNGKISRIDISNKSLLIDLRDESHRFAILHHKKARIKNSKNSQLDRIEGVGVKRRKDLIKYFKNIDSIKKASKEELYGVIKNKKVVNNIYKFFN